MCRIRMDVITVYYSSSMTFVSEIEYVSFKTFASFMKSTSNINWSLSFLIRLYIKESQTEDDAITKLCFLTSYEVVTLHLLLMVNVFSLQMYVSMLHPTKVWEHSRTTKLWSLSIHLQYMSQPFRFETVALDWQDVVLYYDPNKFVWLQQKWIHSHYQTWVLEFRKISIL